MKIILRLLILLILIISIYFCKKRSQFYVQTQNPYSSNEAGDAIVATDIGFYAIDIKGNTRVPIYEIITKQERRRIPITTKTRTIKVQTNDNKIEEHTQPYTDYRYPEKLTPNEELRTRKFVLEGHGLKMSQTLKEVLQTSPQTLVSFAVRKEEGTNLSDSLPELYINIGLLSLDKLQTVPVSHGLQYRDIPKDFARFLRDYRSNEQASSQKRNLTVPGSIVKFMHKHFRQWPENRSYFRIIKNPIQEKVLSALEKEFPINFNADPAKDFYSINHHFSAEYLFNEALDFSITNGERGKKVYLIAGVYRKTSFLRADRLEGLRILEIDFHSFPSELTQPPRVIDFNKNPFFGKTSYRGETKNSIVERLGFYLVNQHTRPFTPIARITSLEEFSWLTSNDIAPNQNNSPYLPMELFLANPQDVNLHLSFGIKLTTENLIPPWLYCQIGFWVPLEEQEENAAFYDYLDRYQQALRLDQYKLVYRKASWIYNMSPQQFGNYFATMANIFSRSAKPDIKLLLDNGEKRHTLYKSGDSTAGTLFIQKSYSKKTIKNIIAQLKKSFGIRRPIYLFAIVQSVYGVEAVRLIRFISQSPATVDQIDLCYAFEVEAGKELFLQKKHIIADEAYNFMMPDFRIAIHNKLYEQGLKCQFQLYVRTPSGIQKRIIADQQSSIETRFNINDTENWVFTIEPQVKGQQPEQEQQPKHGHSIRYWKDTPNFSHQPVSIGLQPTSKEKWEQWLEYHSYEED